MSKMANPNTKEKGKPQAPANLSAQPAKYTKQQFLSSEKYAADKDVLNALLEDGKTYTAEQADQKMKVFLEKEAK